MEQSSQHLIRNLSTPEQFLISALRVWGQGRSDHGYCCCRSLLRNGFHAAGLMATEFETFNRILMLIDSTAPDAMWIETLSEPALSRSETRYLRALAQAQSGDVTQLKWTLSVWLPATAVRAVMPEILKFARSCASVGLVLSAPDDEASAAAPKRVIPLRTLSAQLH